MKRQWNAPMIALGLMIGLLALTEVAAGLSSERRTVGESAWKPYVSEVDGAIARNDVNGARRAWYEARTVAARSGRWQALVDTADAYRRLAPVAGVRDGGASVARELYLEALFRARGATSLAGVVRATEGFESLGDRAVVAQGLRVARTVAARDTDAAARARLEALTQRTSASESPSTAVRF
ncbi:MAG TPA: hypothetical protein VGU22_14915 [Methylomirabilota bacterium]|jgi:hypothetical protein|nr:hypothetical protein [Methylomirabilota bacterium]